MQIPTVTLYKDGRAVDFNECDAAEWIALGWGRTPTEPVAVKVSDESPAPAPVVSRASRRGK